MIPLHAIAKLWPVALMTVGVVVAVALLLWAAECAESARIGRDIDEEGGGK